jgi:hypothetical protein
MLYPLTATLCVCVCVCVRERDRERGRARERERDLDLRSMMTSAGLTQQMFSPALIHVASRGQLHINFGNTSRKKLFSENNYVG